MGSGGERTGNGSVYSGFISGSELGAFGGGIVSVFPSRSRGADGC